METITREKQLEAVSGWWNSDQIVKWDKQYDDWDSHTVRSLNRRLEKVMKAIDSLNLPKGAKVLELGYGAGQTALVIGKCGFEVHGIDISEKFVQIASRRCEKECPDGKFHFKIGNLEEKFEYDDNTFDVVVTSGVLHYLYDDVACLKEAHRVLKSGGHLIIAQRTAYGLCHLTTIRSCLCSLIYFVLREKYELFHSYKSMLCDSKLGFFFGRFRDNKLFNTKFMLKGHDVWKYKLKKNLYSNRRLMSLCKKAGFVPVGVEGAYYCVSDKPKYYNLNLKADDFFEKMANKNFFHFIFPLSRISVILAKKKAV